ncbi:MYND-type domain-containing protein [Mycena venus]|uniref:MYND-type domain-containing protein n=1 Tax=Mycena venus TaxID=2733690 RepID=A0A8H7CRA8_9AGAR|nr:MYND-type domain-containing protein [Mycena venus]
MNHECRECGKPASKRCASCTLSTAWYCSADCQRRNWIEHIFECNPRRNINTSDYLALAVHKNLFPDDPQTCEDFGFARAFSIENRSSLLGLYIGLIERLKISPKKIRQWQVEGTLVENIKATFSTVPAHSRGRYYPWFLRNQWVLDRRLPRPRDPVDEMMMRGWQYVRGGPNTDTPDEIAAEMSDWSEDKQACQLLCNLILSQMHPSPELAIWVTFGFCACHDEEGERRLAWVYTELIKFGKCTFEELYHAYHTSALTSLFNSKGLTAQTEAIPHLEEVLKRSPRVFHSVCYLKQFVLAQGEGAEPIPSVTLDYGFINCIDEAETSRLKDLYRQIFALPRARADLMKLHEACVQGKLYDYVGQLVKFQKRDKKVFKRLLKNPYPLPDV